MKNRVVMGTMIAVSMLVLSACSNSKKDNIVLQTQAQTGVVENVITMPMRGLGTEPFRGFTAQGNKIERRVPAENGSIEKNTFVGVYQQGTGEEIIYKDINQKVTITASHKPCIDGVSEVKYDYTIQVSYQGETFHGCGELIN